jgi:hypothetical protein
MGDNGNALLVTARSPISLSFRSISCAFNIFDFARAREVFLGAGLFACGSCDSCHGYQVRFIPLARERFAIHACHDAGI